ncbi:hypothetical protein AXG55_01550 [Silvanigrella aquatica]|uniref:Uncharacterized protein n=1 Tax=Silvanigrella aquatica TaxID=1915309 RepID=A0A1L4CXK1_9BACT|nr:hypothetical protein AXG55_01550 [Silvanigrella aquatica]
MNFKKIENNITIQSSLFIILQVPNSLSSFYNVEIINQDENIALLSLDYKMNNKFKNKSEIVFDKNNISAQVINDNILIYNCIYL